MRWLGPKGSFSFPCVEFHRRQSNLELPVLRPRGIDELLIAQGFEFYPRASSKQLRFDRCRER